MYLCGLEFDHLTNSHLDCYVTSLVPSTVYIGPVTSNFQNISAK